VIGTYKMERCNLENKASKYGVAKVTKRSNVSGLTIPLQILRRLAILFEELT
jgi:hypothetical protein